MHRLCLPERFVGGEFLNKNGYRAANQLKGINKAEEQNDKVNAEHGQPFACCRRTFQPGAD